MHHGASVVSSPNRLCISQERSNVVADAIVKFASRARSQNPREIRLAGDAGHKLQNKKAGRLGPAFKKSNWLRGLDLNQRPPGYEPDELPGCSTPRKHDSGCARCGEIAAATNFLVLWRFSACAIDAFRNHL